jgi:hypothetical protein
MMSLNADDDEKIGGGCLVAISLMFTAVAMMVKLILILQAWLA